MSSLFSVKGSILGELIFPILVMGLITTGICFLDIFYNVINIEISLSIHALLGVILSLLLVFRTNSAYDRWWEGRKAWGALINNTRGLAINLNALLDKEDQKNRKFFAKAIILFSYLFVDHLRGNDKFKKLMLEEVKEDFIPIKTALHKPSELMKMVMQRIVDLVQKKQIPEYCFLSLNDYVRNIIDCIGVCERIKNTPIPNSYSVFLRRFVFIYSTTLPLGLVHELKWLSIIVVMIVFYIVVGVELLGEEIEDPFGSDPNDLPIEELSEKIESSVKQILGNS